MKKININKEWGMLVVAFLLGVASTLLVVQITMGGQLFQGWLTKTYYSVPTTTFVGVPTSSSGGSYASPSDFD